MKFSTVLILVTIFTFGTSQRCCMLTHFFIGKIQARCCLSKPINCYECDSRSDKRCFDPFNHSGLPEERPPKVQCSGCCVKWVRGSKTSKEVIKRTCISNFQVNLFMIDKHCMQERSKTGHMCFCEEEACNGASILSINHIIVFVNLFIYNILR